MILKKRAFWKLCLSGKSWVQRAWVTDIAVPHARYPVVTHIPHPIVSLCFLEQSIDYGAIDGKPVDCLFTLISPTVRSHLHMLSRITYVLKDENVKNAVVSQQSRESILSKIEHAEDLLAR